MLQGKKLSILGDSISTYRDISNDPAANSTISFNPYFYRHHFPKEKTYWYRLMDEFGLSLCVNNSWSGGNLTGRDNPVAGVNRVHHLTHRSGAEPDLILVFMGINDLGRRVPPEVFSEDYRQVLAVLKSKYPQAMVCCVNLPDRDIVMKQQTMVFNRIIADAVEQAGDGFFVADLFSSRLNNDVYYDNTVDGLHPDEDGMRYIAEVIGDAIRAHLAGDVHS